MQCSELVSDTGEWRTVAFFNEDRKLGDWYYRSIDEVKAELSVFKFEGDCSTTESSVRLITKFPVRDSLDRLSTGRIELKDVQIKTNAPVTASFSPRNQTYQFSLPYMYSSRNERSLTPTYTLFPQRVGDRYAVDVINHWDCKSVRASDVTFQFMICETATLPSDVRRGTEREQTFGAYAYFILSDGKEAMTSTRLSFGGDAARDANPTPPAKTEAEPVPGPVRAAAIPDTATREIWQAAAPTMKLTEIGGNEFRIRFNSQMWANKVGSGQVLSDSKLSPLDPAKLPSGVDYCIWRPAGATLASRALSNQPDTEIAFALTTTDGTRSSPASISIDLKTYTGARIGMLQCMFVRAEAADSITVGRWVAVVGGNLNLEINP
jgi:hypothetical protein